MTNVTLNEEVCNTTLEALRAAFAVGDDDKAEPEFKATTAEEGSGSYVSFYDQYGPYTILPNYVFKYGRYLSPEAKWLYTTLRSFSNNQTGKTNPSYPKLMERSGMGRNAVADASDELQEFNWIRKNKHFNHATDYVLGFPERGGKFVVYPTKEDAEGYRDYKRAERNRKRERRANRSQLAAAA